MYLNQVVEDNNGKILYIKQRLLLSRNLRDSPGFCTFVLGQKIFPLVPEDCQLAEIISFPLS